MLFPIEEPAFRLKKDRATGRGHRIPCICEGRGFYRPWNWTTDGWPEACPACLGRGTVSLYRAAKLLGVSVHTLMHLDWKLAPPWWPRSRIVDHRIKPETAWRIIDGVSSLYGEWAR